MNVKNKRIIVLELTEEEAKQIVDFLEMNMTGDDEPTPVGKLSACLSEEV